MEDNDLVWFAIVNPHAGSGKTLPHWEKAEALLRAKGIKYTYRVTDCQYHAVEIAYEAAKEGFRKFLAVGGDGTVHETLDGIMHSVTDAQIEGGSVCLSDFTLAVIPIGSGNDWIKSHNVPHDEEAVVEMIANESFAMQDVVKVSSLELPDSDKEASLARASGNSAVKGVSYMINVGGVGLDAKICEKVNLRKEKGKSGRMLYINALITTILKTKNFNASVICDGEKVYEGPCLSIAFGIGKYSGGGFRQTPEAVMDDSLTELTVIPALPFHRIAREAYRLLDGTFLKIRELITSKSRVIDVLPLDGDTQPVEVDGEVVGRIPMRFETLPDRIRVLHQNPQEHH